LGKIDFVWIDRGCFRWYKNLALANFFQPRLVCCLQEVSVNRIYLLFLSILILVVLAGCASGNADVATDRNSSGFDEYGYNEVARIFNGPADGVDRNLDGTVWGDPTYGADHLTMKWNREWDRGNDENWANGPYDAWENNEWNGKVPGGSGEVWHYKIIWIGSPANSTNPRWRDGGAGVWGQFEIVMSQGTAGEHFWDLHANPTGYGGPH
jgi:hypothetical protein